MTTPQLIEWLDEKMETYGSGKLIPPPAVLEEDLKTRVEGKIRSEITERIVRPLDRTWRSGASAAAFVFLF